jgi:small subunit ribosomal protein S16
MSVRIRLRRIGRKKQPYYRVVVMPSTAPRDGAYIEEVGFYNPRTRPAFLTMDLAKVDSWLEKGAEVTESAASLIRKARKGGDAAVRFVQPGEEAPVMKTASRAERRPSARPATPDATESTPEVEPVTDPLEGAAADAEKEPPADATEGETKQAVDALASEGSAPDDAEETAETSAADAAGGASEALAAPAETEPRGGVETEADTSDETDATTAAAAAESEERAEDPEAGGSPEADDQDKKEG